MLNNRVSPILDAEIEDFLVNRNLKLKSKFDKQVAFMDARRRIVKFRDKILEID